jgi:hypothetical protein
MVWFGTFFFTELPSHKSTYYYKFAILPIHLFSSPQHRPSGRAFLLLCHRLQDYHQGQQHPQPRCHRRPFSDPLHHPIPSSPLPHTMDPSSPIVQWRLCPTGLPRTEQDPPSPPTRHRLMAICINRSDCSSSRSVLLCLIQLN